MSRAAAVAPALAPIPSPSPSLLRTLDDGLAHRLPDALRHRSPDRARACSRRTASDSIPSTGPGPSVFPFSVEGLGEVRVAVPPDQADDGACGSSRSTGPHARRGRRARSSERSRISSSGSATASAMSGLLEHALTHKSKAHEDASGGVVDNESLEFLGDAVLGFVVADMLFREFPHFHEGQKSKVKAALVSTAALARAGAAASGSASTCCSGAARRRPAAAASRRCWPTAARRVIAAIYLDGGIEAARDFILRELRRRDRARAVARLPARLQVGAAGASAGARTAAARLRGHGRARARSRQAVSRRACGWRRGAGGLARAGRRRKPNRKPRAWRSSARWPRSSQSR